MKKDARNSEILDSVPDHSDDKFVINPSIPPIVTNKPVDNNFFVKVSMIESPDDQLDDQVSEITNENALHSTSRISRDLSIQDLIKDDQESSSGESK